MLKYADLEWYNQKLFEVIMKDDRPDSVVKPAALDQRKNVEIQI